MSKKRKKRESFFAEQSAQSKVKADIMAKYSSAWSSIVGRNQQKLVYSDIFAGCGRYEDGKPSTPLLVLERAIADPHVREILVTLFNDADPATAEQLEREIAKLPDVDKLRHRPRVFSSQVGPDMAALFQKKDMPPTLAFIDPWGYKGVSRDLIAALIKDWASECAFFFNYNRISMGLTNPVVGKHMRAIFGEIWLEELRAAVVGLTPRERERTILRALKAGLRELGAQQVVTFRFRRNNGRTSHYLIFVTKHELGCNIMRDVMAGASSYKDVDGVASFDHDPRLANEPELELREGGRLGRLKQRLLKWGAARTLSVKRVFDEHSHYRPYTFSNYQEALRQLELEEVIRVQRPAGGKKVRSGRPTMPKEAIVTFPRR